VFGSLFRVRTTTSINLSFDRYGQNNLYEPLEGKFSWLTGCQGQPPEGFADLKKTERVPDR
jgi:hypothetical protein